MAKTPRHLKRPPVGKTIRRLRLAKGLVQRDGCRATGLSPSFWSDLELGKRSLSAESLYLIARWLDVSLDDLWEGTAV